MTAVPVKKMTGALTVSPFFNAFAPLQREIDRVFEDFVPSFWPSANPVDVRCKLNLAETKDGLELTVELPGLEEKDVNVEVSDGVLTVSGEKKFESEQKDKNYRMVERGYGSFSRSIELPAGVKADQIKAALAKGVLTVTIPAAPTVAPKKIEVKAAP
jgi:HSP20 family protein